MVSELNFRFVAFVTRLGKMASRQLRRLESRNGEIGQNLPHRGLGAGPVPLGVLLLPVGDQETRIRLQLDSSWPKFFRRSMVQ